MLGLGQKEYLFSDNLLVWDGFPLGFRELQYSSKYTYTINTKALIYYGCVVIFMSFWIFKTTCGEQVLGKIRRMVVTHVPTGDLPRGFIYWRILPTNCGSRSTNPRLRDEETLAGSLVLPLSSPRYRVEGSLLALNIRKKTAALGSGSKVPLYPGLV